MLSRGESREKFSSRRVFFFTAGLIHLEEHCCCSYREPVGTHLPAPCKHEFCVIRLPEKTSKKRGKSLKYNMLFCVHSNKCMIVRINKCRHRVRRSKPRQTYSKESNLRFVSIPNKVLSFPVNYRSPPECPHHCCCDGSACEERRKKGHNQHKGTFRRTALPIALISIRGRRGVQASFLRNQLCRLVHFSRRGRTVLYLW
jgi:hypothetical protein